MNTALVNGTTIFQTIKALWRLAISETHNVCMSLLSKDHLAELS